MRQRRTSRLAGQPAQPAAESGPKVGWLVEGSAPGQLRVDYPGNAVGACPARSIVALDERSIQRAVHTRQGALLQFEEGQADKPILLGLIEQDASPLVELLWRAPSPAANGVKPARAAQARLDGRRVVLEADHEIVLKCGDASLTLTRDGKVVVKGAYIETHASGVNRIKGGAVKIN